MKNKQANISHLNKYLKGELDSTAMHKLERDALNDPFLAEALEGYEAIEKDQTPAMRELKARLQKRTSEKKRVPVIAIRIFAIAASVLLLLTFGTLYVTRSSKKPVSLVAMKPKSKPPSGAMSDSIQAGYAAAQKNENIASRASESSPAAAVAKKYKSAKSSGKTIKTAGKEPGSSSSDSKILLADEEKTKNRQLIARNAPAPPAMADAAPKTPAEPPAKADEDKDERMRGDTNQVVVTALGIKRTRATLGYTTMKSPDKKASRVQDSSIGNTLSGKVSGVNVAQARTAPAGSPRVLLRGNSSVSSPPPLYVIDGVPSSDTLNLTPDKIRSITVLKGEGARALYGLRAANGVILITTNRARSTVTTKDSASSQNANPLFGYNAPNADHSFNEVVVTRKLSRYYEAPDTNERLSPIPLRGWDFYNHYLEMNESTYPGKGRVKLSFMVDDQGKLDQFKIIKSLNPDANAKAIDLIKKGPKWLGKSDHSPGRVTLIVRFRSSK